MKTFISTLFITIIVFSSPAFSADAPWRGIWQGTIGGQQVMVCLDTTDDSSYYYQRHSYGISLSSKNDSGDRWIEMSNGKKTGEWKLNAVSYSRLTGSWFAPKGKRSAPIILERVNALSGDELCDSEAYNDPRVDATKFETGKVQHFEGKSFRTFSAGVKDDISTIEILEKGPRIGRINRALHKKLRENIVSSFQCHSYVGKREDGLAYYSVTETPVFWTARWLTLAKTAESFCGGAHPNHSYFYNTWDLELGSTINLWTWFTGSEKEPSAVLNKVIISHSKRDDECAEAISENTDYSLHPSKEGMVFNPHRPHVAAGCQDDIVIPYNELLPFLTPAGLSEVRALMKGTAKESN